MLWAAAGVGPQSGAGDGLVGSQLRVGAGAAAGEPAGSAQAPVVRQGFFEIVFSGGWVGITIMIFLIALSVTAVYLMIDHLLTIRRSDIMPEGLSDHVRELLAAGQLAEADLACRTSRVSCRLC